MESCAEIPDTNIGKRVLVLEIGNSSGSEQDCNKPEGTPILFDKGRLKKLLELNKGAVPTATDCNFSCKSDHVKSVSTYSCNKAKTCNIRNGQGQNLWRSGAYSTTCEVVDCDSGFVKNMGGNSCDIPDTGKYADNVGREQDCDGPTGDTGGFKAFAVNTGAVSTPTGCGFSCNTGYVKSGRSCNFPALGKYVQADATTEASCDANSITTEGTATFTWTAGAAATANSCPFSCSAGYVADIIAQECNYPTQGNYVNASGAEVGCTNITGITGFSTWKSGAATDADACPFSCDSGYTISGRMYRYGSPRICSFCVI